MRLFMFWGGRWTKCPKCNVECETDSYYVTIGKCPICKEQYTSKTASKIEIINLKNDKQR